MPANSVSTIGLGVLGLNSELNCSGTGNAYYLADFAYARGPGNESIGRLRVASIGDTTNTTATTGMALDRVDPQVVTDLAIQTVVTYTLRLTGTYAGGILNMSLGLYDAAGTTQIGNEFGTLTDSTALTGENFGYRIRAETSDNTRASFDNFALQSVPEPTSFALLVSASALFAVRRKRA